MSSVTVPSPTTYDEDLLLFQRVSLQEIQELLAPSGSPNLARQAIFYDLVSRPLLASETHQQLAKASPSNLETPKDSRENQILVSTAQFNVADPENGTMDITAPPVTIQVPPQWNNFRVIQFPSCELVSSFLRNLGTRIGMTQGYATQLLDSRNVRAVKLQEAQTGISIFRCGFSLRATTGNLDSSQDSSCTLFLAIPYLSAGSPGSNRPWKIDSNQTYNGRPYGEQKQVNVSSHSLGGKQESQNNPGETQNILTPGEKQPFHSSLLSRSKPESWPLHGFSYLQLRDFLTPCSQDARNLTTQLGGYPAHVTSQIDVEYGRPTSGIETTSPPNQFAGTVSQVYFVVTSGDFSHDTLLSDAPMPTPPKTSPRLRTIATFNSTDDQHARQSPLFSGQSRAGPLDTLIDMLAAFIEGQEKDELIKVRSELIKQENEFQNLQIFSDGIIAWKQSYLPPPNMSKMILDLKNLSFHAESIKNLVDAQINILKRLRQIFINASSVCPDITLDVKFRNMWEVPALSREHGEELLIAVPKLDQVIKNREEVCDIAKILIGDIKDAQGFLLGYLTLFDEMDESDSDSNPPYIQERSIKEATAKRTMTFPKSRIEQRYSKMNTAATHSLVREVKAAGGLISIYTIMINCIVLLQFFCAYYSLDTVKDTIHSVADFWKTCGPLTAAFFVIPLTYELHRKGILIRLWELCTVERTPQKKLQSYPARSRTS